MFWVVGQCVEFEEELLVFVEFVFFEQVVQGNEVGVCFVFYGVVLVQMYFGVVNFGGEVILLCLFWFSSEVVVIGCLL